MAGEWLKFDCSLPDKPETLAITAALGWDDPDLTVGKLMRLFRWFDQQTIDGNAAGVTPALLDRVVGVSGFVQALQNVGWIVVSASGLALHNFEKHNGKTAKSRAQTAVRVANHRASDDGDAARNAPVVTTALAREEKRREEKKEDPPASRVPRPTRKCPEQFSVTDEMREWAALKAPGVALTPETEAFKDYTFRSAISDWDGAWRNWMRRAAKSVKPQQSGETAWQRSQRERVAEMTGGLLGNRPPARGDIIDMEPTNGTLPAVR